MHTIIRTYRVEDGDIDEALHRVDRSFADRLSHEPGFIAYECFATRPDVICSISTFRDKEAGERSNELAAQFVREELGDMRIAALGTIGGEVQVSRAAREVLDPAHL